MTLATESSSAEAAEKSGSFAAKPGEWPHWRGPEMNGVSREKGLVDDWSPGRGSSKGKNVLWHNKELGTRSTPIVMNGKLYTFLRDKPATAQEAEKVVCVDAETGKILWENKFNVYLSEVPDTRLGWSSVVGDPETGNIFAQGVCGLFLCIDGKTGKTVWQRSLHEEYGLLSTYGGRTNFPIIHENLVIISAVIIGWGEMAKPAHRFVAFDKRNGQPVWFESTRLFPSDTTFATPALGVIDGKAQLVVAAGDGLMYGLQPRTGKTLWSYEASARGLNTSPIIVGNTVINGHSEENLEDNSMGAFFALDATKKGMLTEKNKGVIWRVKGLGVGKAGPLALNGKIYCIDDSATLHVLDAKTGQETGKQKLGTISRPSPVYADGKIYVCENNGLFFVLKPSADGKVRVVSRQRLNGEEINASPIIAMGKIFITTSEGIYCIGKKGNKVNSDPIPPLPEETDAGMDPTAAQAQVVPCEVLLTSGQKQSFSVRLYNAGGQYLRTAAPSEVKFEVKGAGQIDADGRFSTAKDQKQAAATIVATVGKVKGDARIRVIPELPWTFDFNDGEIPVTWVGARYRQIVIDFDLFTALEKENPLAADFYTFVLTGFINGEMPVVKYEDLGKRQNFTDMLRFLRLADKVRDLEQAKQQIDPLLKILEREKVVAKWTWSKSPKGNSVLTVNRGSRKLTGNGVLYKITTIPLGTRSQGWFGPPDLSNYTIQADVMGLVKEGKLPDAGLICQRYRIDLMGAAQQVKAVSWYAHEIKFKDEPFAWKAKVWYTMKMTVGIEMKDGKQVSVVKGKVWERGKPEPKDWSIAWTDEPANLHGSPGLFGNAKDSEVVYDNIKVIKN